MYTTSAFSRHRKLKTTQMRILKQAYFRENERPHILDVCTMGILMATHFVPVLLCALHRELGRSTSESLLHGNLRYLALVSLLNERIYSKMKPPLELLAEVLHQHGKVCRQICWTLRPSSIGTRAPRTCDLCIHLQALILAHCLFAPEVGNSKHLLPVGESIPQPNHIFTDLGWLYFGCLRYFCLCNRKGQR